jgi:hypothetical protein
MQAVGTRQWVPFGERVGQCGNWFFEQVEDRPVGGVPQWLRQCFDFVPGPVRKAEDQVTH